MFRRASWWCGSMRAGGCAPTSEPPGPRSRAAACLDVVVDSAADADLALISPYNDEGAVFLYHRPLSCGLRLAATAGTDVFLSFSHGPGVASNPPGWGRVYAQLGDRGPGAERLTLVGPDGVMAKGGAASELRLGTTLDGPTWIAAVARGAGHPNTLDQSVLAHTSPVYVDVAGQRVARAEIGRAH